MHNPTADTNDTAGMFATIVARAPGQRDVCKEAAKVLTFIDMGGHERCLKTALYGLTA